MGNNLNYYLFYLLIIMINSLFKKKDDKVMTMFI